MPGPWRRCSRNRVDPGRKPGQSKGQVDGRTGLSLVFTVRVPERGIAAPANLPMLKAIESVVLFVPDIHAAAQWYASLFGTVVEYENPQYAYIQAPGLFYGFHPTDEKCPGGVGGTTVYWHVENLELAVAELVGRGAKLHRGPATTSLGAGVAMLICPFGCTIGLNCATPRSRAALFGPAGHIESGADASGAGAEQLRL